MPEHDFAKPFPKHISTDDKPLGLYPSKTSLTACIGFTNPQLGALDTAAECKPQGHHLPDLHHT